MPSTSGAINYRESFEIPVITKIHGEPTADSLILLLKELKANATSIYSNLGGGTHGHLFLVIPPEQFNLISNAPFVRPVHPGPLVIPPGTTAAMTVTLKDIHTENLRLFREVHGVEKALISQIVSAIDAAYIDTLRSRTTNAIPGPVHAVLTYLKETYGRVTAQLLDDKETNVRAMNYHPSTPIDTIFTAVEDLTDYADLNGSPMTQHQCISKAYLILNKGGQLKEEIKSWNRLPQAQKTWIAFKVHFRRAHNEYRELTNTTLEEAANAQRDAHLVQRVIEGVQATITDDPASTEIANEVANIASQVTQNQAVIPQLVNQIHQMQAMMHQMQCQLLQHQPVPPPPPPYQQTPPQFQPPPAQHFQQQPNTQQQPGWMRGGRGRGGRGRGGRGRGGRRNAPTGYCWTHGMCFHTSQTCNTPAEGHQVEATYQNRMGGNHRNCNT